MGTNASPANRQLPTGTLTFLFTDIEGSTRLLQRLGPAYQAVLERHSEILRTSFHRHGGHVVTTEGDSFFVVFRSALSAALSVVEVQRQLASASFGEGVEVRVRMGLHTGEGVRGGDNYAGLDVNRAARVAASGHGGQVVLTAPTAALVEPTLSEGVTLKNLGGHRLKDLPREEHLFQLVIPGLRARFPPLRSLESRPHNLPVQLTSFVGRRTVIGQIAELLREVRMVTLTGPGGTGKTRLSLEVAREMLPEFEHGVFFVPLAPITNPALLMATIAKALGLQERGNTGIQEVLDDYLEDKQILLVLDNFEQLIHAAREVTHLLQVAPRCKVLVSSRAVLHVSGENEFPVPPLNLPSPANLPPVEILTQYEAVALFIERASAVKPGFTVTNANAHAVAEICARLDGLPLAIELAAARVRLLSPQAILSRLQESLKFLTGGAVDLPQRQQTLRNAIAWSYNLLDEPERSLFRSLSVFRGGWSLDSAELVCESAGDIVDLIASLADKSLIRTVETQADEPRFMMLETMREFGWEMARAEGQGQALRARHAGVFVDLAERARSEMDRNQVEWLDRLETEHNNIRAALRFFLETSDAENGLRVGADIWRFWHLRGYLAEGRRWIEDFLHLPSATASQAAQAAALSAGASLAYWQSDFSAAHAHYRAALDLYRGLNDQAGAADTLMSLGFVAAALAPDSDHQGALAFYRESREISRTIGNAKAEGWAGAGLAMVSLLLKDYDTALEEGHAALRTFRLSNDKFAIASALALMGQICRYMGDQATALPFIKEATEIYAELGDLSGLTGVLDDLSVISTQRGDLRQAVTLYAASSAFKERVGASAPSALVRIPDPRFEASKALSDREIEDAWRLGNSMSPEEATAYLLEELDGGSPAPR